MLELEGKHEQDMRTVTQQSEKLGFLEQQVPVQSMSVMDVVNSYFPP